MIKTASRTFTGGCFSLISAPIIFDICKKELLQAVNVALSMYNRHDNTSGEAYAKWAYDAFKAGSLKINDVDLISFYVTKKYNKKGSQSVPPATQGSLSGGARFPNSSVTQNEHTVNNNGMQNGKKYSVKRDIDGNKFVDVDPDLFDARDGESHAKTIARIIKDRFDNLISVNGQQIQINKTTNDEWRRSNGADAL